MSEHHLEPGPSQEFADLVGRRLPIRLGDGRGPVIGVAEVTGPAGEVRMTIPGSDPGDADLDLGVSLVCSTAQLAQALGRPPALQPTVDTSAPILRSVPIPPCPGGQG